MKAVFSLFVTLSPDLLLLKLAEAASQQDSCVQLRSLSGCAGISGKNLGNSPFPVVGSVVVVNCVTPSLAGTRRPNVHRLPDGKDEQSVWQNTTLASTTVS